MDGWITCLIRDKVMIYLKSVVYTNRQQQAAVGSNRGNFGLDCPLFNKAAVCCDRE
jgi:hypothetical protein